MGWTKKDPIKKQFFSLQLPSDTLCQSPSLPFFFPHSQEADSSFLVILRYSSRLSFQVINFPVLLKSKPHSCSSTLLISKAISSNSRAELGAEPRRWQGCLGTQLRSVWLHPNACTFVGGVNEFFGYLLSIVQDPDASQCPLLLTSCYICSLSFGILPSFIDEFPLDGSAICYRDDLSHQLVEV